MDNVVHVRDPLDLRVGKLRAVIEKPGQMAYIDITILVEGGGDHRAAVLLIKLQQVRTASEK